MRIDDIQDLRRFVGIVNQGGLTAAVKTLGTPKSTLSRTLSALEDQVGARLVERTSQRFQLTEAGAVFYRHALRIIDELALMEDALQSGEPSGHLRITTGFAFAVEALGPILPEFLARYPRISVHVEGESGLRDLEREPFDVAIRSGPLTGASLIAKRLGKTELGLFASPAYLTRIGVTTTSISSRPTIGLSRAGDRDPIETKNNGHRRERPRLVVNDPFLLKSHLIAGFGSGWLPLPMALKDVAVGKLVRCRPRLTRDGGEVFALFPKRTKMPLKTRVFIDFITQHLKR